MAPSPGRLGARPGVFLFVRLHQTCKTTPAMAADVADHEWRLAEIVALLDQIPADEGDADSN